MPLNDLTPELRTRLNRVERRLGWFVLGALLLMVGGFGYYLYHTAQVRGWFLIKAPYFTYVRSGAGLKAGDKVKLMGFDAGEILKVEAEKPNQPVDVYVSFQIRHPYYGYIWTDSRVKVKASGVFGSRYLEVTKGKAAGSVATYREKDHELEEIWKPRPGGGLGDGEWLAFDPDKKGTGQDQYYLAAEEPPELSEQIDEVARLAKDAIPQIIALTNTLVRTVQNLGELSETLRGIGSAAGPAVTNLLQITEQIKDPHGGLGEWLIPMGINRGLTQALATANTTLRSADAVLVTARTTVSNSDDRIALVVSNLNISLTNLAGITSNLNAQVGMNTNFLGSVHQLIVNVDDMVQGLKRHWLLRSAFKTNAPPATNFVPRAAFPMRAGPGW